MAAGARARCKQCRAGRTRHTPRTADPQRAVEPFFGEHQAGIVTPQQSHTYVAALDLVTDKREDVIALLRDWTDAAARMTRGDTAKPLPADDKVAPDSADVLGLGTSGLTITFGFGPGLFTHDGKDRYGLGAAPPGRARRPAALQRRSADRRKKPAAT